MEEFAKRVMLDKEMVRFVKMVADDPRHLALWFDYRIRREAVHVAALLLSLRATRISVLCNRRIMCSVGEMLQRHVTVPWLYVASDSYEAGRPAIRQLGERQVVKFYCATSLIRDEKRLEQVLDQSDVVIVMDDELDIDTSDTALHKCRVLFFCVVQRKFEIVHNNVATASGDVNILSNRKGCMAFIVE
jgi:hypothetical protein